ncbi:alkaline ceramidase 1 isoform X2 [Mustela erminea]|uniref:alkaline ceramidase 1 isoform X2 n=1 Tax=Mustela erminea TaxID=36723 RepID=UPI0013875D6D|nr:alkaline ceramidase 1 isoform X2 [Mustela erminea]
MPSIFAYQSSEVDWCESNFQHSELVAEFYNTFSNVTFLIFGPLMMFLMHPYAQKRSRYVYITCVLFMVVGLFSMYFHMTLSFLGQLLDEIAILWLLASGYSIWMPRCYFPTFLGENRPQFICLVVITTVVSTFLSFLRPVINAYALNSIAVHILYIVFQEYKKWVVVAEPAIRSFGISWRSPWFYGLLHWPAGSVTACFAASGSRSISFTCTASGMSSSVSLFPMAW